MVSTLVPPVALALSTSLPEPPARHHGGGPLAAWPAGRNRVAHPSRGDADTAGSVVPAASTPAPEGTGTATQPGAMPGAQARRAVGPGIPTGFAALDARLAGGGWPCRGLTELLLPAPGAAELRLLAPALAGALAAGRTVMLFDPPASLSAWALAQVGLDARQLLVIQGRSPVLPDAGSLWALEQALASGNVGAVVAWLPPRLRADRLRRLQEAARRHEGPAFILREASARDRPTTAPLRLAAQAAGTDRVVLRLLGRHGALPVDVLQLDLPPLKAAPAGTARDDAAEGRALRRARRAGPTSAASAERPGAGLPDAARFPLHAKTAPGGLGVAEMAAGGPNMTAARAEPMLLLHEAGHRLAPRQADTSSQGRAGGACTQAPPIGLLGAAREAATARPGPAPAQEAPADDFLQAAWHAPLHSAVFVDLGA